MESIRRLAWALERGQAPGLDEKQFAGHFITRVERLRLTYGGNLRKFSLAQNRVDHHSANSIPFRVRPLFHLPSSESYG